MDRLRSRGRRWRLPRRYQRDGMAPSRPTERPGATASARKALDAANHAGYLVLDRFGCSSFAEEKELVAQVCSRAPAAGDTRIRPSATKTAPTPTTWKVHLVRTTTARRLAALASRQGVRGTGTSVSVQNGCKASRKGGRLHGPRLSSPATSRGQTAVSLARPGLVSKARRKIREEISRRL